MKIKIAALALLLAAGASPAALAQQTQDPGHDWGQGRPHDGRGGHPGQQGARQPAAAPPAPAAPPQPQTPRPAPQPRAVPGGHWGADPRANAGPRPPGAAPHRPQVEDPRNRGGADGRAFVRRPGRWVDSEGDDTSQGLKGADRQDQEDRQELRDWRRFNGDRGGERIRPDGRAFEGDRRSQDAPRDDRRFDRDHERGRGPEGRPQWRPDAYPHSFHSPQRFRVRPYRHPPHYYVHVWSYGEILPPTWFGPEYGIGDWWNYDLPAPPPGYDWVRVGDDAILVDEYNGRIVQVVRGLFW